MSGFAWRKMEECSGCVGVVKRLGAKWLLYVADARLNFSLEDALRSHAIPGKNDQRFEP
jgi:hypothetical protein